MPVRYWILEPNSSWRRPRLFECRVTVRTNTSRTWNPTANSTSFSCSPKSSGRAREKEEEPVLSHGVQGQHASVFPRRVICTLTADSVVAMRAAMMLDIKAGFPKEELMMQLVEEPC